MRTVLLTGIFLLSLTAGIFLVIKHVTKKEKSVIQTPITPKPFNNQENTNENDEINRQNIQHEHEKENIKPQNQDNHTKKNEKNVKKSTPSETKIPQNKSGSKDKPSNNTKENVTKPPKSIENPSAKPKENVSKPSKSEEKQSAKPKENATKPSNCEEKAKDKDKCSVKNSNTDLRKDKKLQDKFSFCKKIVDIAKQAEIMKFSKPNQTNISKPSKELIYYSVVHRINKCFRNLDFKGSYVNMKNDALSKDKIIQAFQKFDFNPYISQKSSPKFDSMEEEIDIYLKEKYKNDFLDLKND